MLSFNASGTFNGISDSVKCYHCGAGLNLWEYGDNAWSEHKRVSPYCLHLLQNDRELCERMKVEMNRDANDVINEWIDGILVTQFANKVQLSRNLIRNVLYNRWLNEKLPFRSIEDLAEASELFLVSFTGVYCKMSDLSLTSSMSHLSISPDHHSNYRLICKICYDNDSNIVFVPCGHLVCCSICSAKINYCPYCRTIVLSAIKAFIC